MSEVWLALTIVYAIGAMSTALMFMLEEKQFSLSACAWGAAWGFLVFVYGPFVVMRDIWNGSAQTREHERINVD